jgi:predicted nucleic acid-binding Zn ribbon protein
LRRSKTISLADAMKDYIREMNLEDKLNEISVINSWNDLVGRTIASRTVKIYIRDKILHVHLNSSVVRNELLMLRQSIVDKLNKKAGAEVIRDIVFR